ncbi:MAG: hypothetical protein Q9163_002173 [Psora crenata]
MDLPRETDAPKTQRQEPQPSSAPIAENAHLPQTVRFASVNQEIEPARSLQSASHTSDRTISGPSLDPQAEVEIRNLQLGLHHSHIQQRMTSNFAFEPCSLPVSRAPSNESAPYQFSGEPTRSGGPSPRMSPPASAMTTPPLTRHGTQSREGKKDDASDPGVPKVHPDPVQMAPQTSTPKLSSQLPADSSSTSLSASRPSTGGEMSTGPTSLSQESSSDEVRSKKAGDFVLGPSVSSSSRSRSRDTSHSRTPSEGGHDTTTPPTGFPRPFTPGGDKGDPYARSKRPPQSKNLESIDARFVFGASDARRRSGIGLGSMANSSASLPHSSSGKDLKSEHKKSTFPLLGGKDHKDHHGRDDKHGSMSDLKRFFGMGSSHHRSKRSESPAAPSKASTDKAGTRTPPRHAFVAPSVPFADDHGLETKYGKFGRILGSGAGGSVRLLKRSSDGRTFAVKQFRDRHNYESPRDYNKKVTAEFCIGSTLHHGNIIETLDIVQEGGRWFEVMEYAPYDLFAIVMTGKMTREEITCCFLQIMNGVAFLHGCGLAHRDLKLDNVVVNEYGIMKIIDFGSASVFKYPFENDIILASGVVGSDPYLAPEVYDEHKYDPQPADIWSLAIIFACMSLRRFPWKAPRITDNSFKLFIAEPPTEPEETSHKERPKVAADGSNAPPNEGKTPASAQGNSHQHHHQSQKRGNSAEAKLEDAQSDSAFPPGSKSDVPKAEIIRGPWRLLRLLPRETRPIIGAMLRVDPKQRATLADMISDPWIATSPVCQQLEHGKVLRAGAHTHTLEPGSTTPGPTGK